MSHDYINLRTVSVQRKRTSVLLYAADNYAEDAEWLNPDEAREIAAALISAADDAEREQQCHDCSPRSIR